MYINYESNYYAVNTKNHSKLGLINLYIKRLNKYYL